MPGKVCTLAASRTVCELLISLEDGLRQAGQTGKAPGGSKSAANLWGDPTRQLPSRQKLCRCEILTETTFQHFIVRSAHGAYLAMLHTSVTC